jgi:hypothetical protein
MYCIRSGGRKILHAYARKDDEFTLSSVEQPSMHVAVAINNNIKHMQIPFQRLSGRITATDNELRRGGGPVEILPFAPGASKSHEPTGTQNGGPPKATKYDT